MCCDDRWRRCCGDDRWRGRGPTLLPRPVHTLAQPRREHCAWLTLEVVGVVVAGHHAWHTPARTRVTTLLPRPHTVPALHPQRPAHSADLSCVHLSCPQHPPVVPAAVPGVLKDALARAADAGFNDILGVAPVWGTTAILAGPGLVCQLPERLHTNACSPVTHLGIPALRPMSRPRPPPPPPLPSSSPPRASSSGRSKKLLSLGDTCSCQAAARASAPLRVLEWRRALLCPAAPTCGRTATIVSRTKYATPPLPGVGSGAGVVEGVAVITVVCRSPATFCIQ